MDFPKEIEQLFTIANTAIKKDKKLLRGLQRGDPKAEVKLAKMFANKNVNIIGGD